MKPRESPFKLSAQNSLKVNEIMIENDKNLLLTFKGHHDLRQQLYKNKDKSTIKVKDSKNSTILSKVKPEDQSLMQEVAALDNFKAPVTRQKTKLIIENIKLRRRQKHIETYNRFREDLEEYKENVEGIYSSLENDAVQILNIKELQLRQFLKSQTQSYLLSREKQILKELDEELQNYQNQILGKLQDSRNKLQKIKEGRANIVDGTCDQLAKELVDIAFMLQPQILDIKKKQKEEIQKFQDQTYKRFYQNLKNIEQKQKITTEQLIKQKDEIKIRWKSIKEDYEINSYIIDVQKDELKNPFQRQSLYKKLIILQQQNSKRKINLLNNLCKQNPDSLSKLNIDKWNEHLKIINEWFGQQLDQLMAQLVKETNQSKSKNLKRYEYLQNRIIYIQHKNKEQAQTYVKQKCEPLCTRNNSSADELVKKAVGYAQDADGKENEALQKLGGFLNQLAIRNDDFTKKFATKNQQYEMQKAKILDDDDENLQKLNEELQNLKKQLKQSLHHIKLQELEKLCFQKIDQIEEAYRKTHLNNKNLVAKRPADLAQFIKLYEAQIAEIFALYDQSKRQELVEKNKKEAEELATKKVQQEQKKKLEEENRLIEEAKKKGGKPPPPAKPKDPKKALAEFQERKKVILSQIGVKTIQEITTNTGSIWLVYKNLEEICAEFYIRKEKQGKIQEGMIQEKNLKVDELDEQIVDVNNQPVVTRKCFITIRIMAQCLDLLRSNFFSSVGLKKTRILEEAQIIDNQLLEKSLSILDDRLKEHYSLKGKLESQVYVKRSGQIASHKKEYQKHARLTKEKMDLQTEKFNYLLEKSLQLMKKHTQDQKGVRQSLTQGKSLADFQSTFRKAHQNHKIFTNQIKEIGAQLGRLSNAEVDAILKKNDEFLKKSKLIENGGEFSQSETEWYKTMMQEINKQIQGQKAKRNEKSKEIIDHTEKKSKELLEIFEKDYINLIQQLSAKEGTGKKYGKPKRIAQEKIRLQMNKCEQAQISIDKQIQEISRCCFEFNQSKQSFPSKPSTLQWRKMLMTLQTCINRYAKHIEALVPNLKIKQMARVNYNQSLPQIILGDEEEQDKKRLVQQLAALGPLSEQKDEKVFIKYIEDIEKVIGDQSRLIYVGDKAKYLTGNDKIPDFLRFFIQNMNKNAQEFRQASIRSLRKSCIDFSETIEKVVDMFTKSIGKYYKEAQINNVKIKRDQFEQFYKNQRKIRDNHLNQLRPNLAHPKCQDELRTLDQNQKKRQIEYDETMKSFAQKFQDEHFLNGSQFLNCLLNNYEFLLLFTDSLLLFEDFVKVSGDESQEKIHLDAKRLMLIKQKGVTIDSTSQRNIRKNWEGLNCSFINFKDKKFALVAAPKEEPKEKDKKGAKKESKDKKGEEVIQKASDVSKSIQTFKTWRQKYVFTSRQSLSLEFKNQYTKMLQKMKSLIEESIKENESFKLKWEAIAKDLYVS